MTLTNQLKHAALLGPSMLFRLGRGGWIALGIYVSLAAVVMAVTGATLLAHREDVRGLILSYLFPSGWHGAADVLVDAFLVNQTRAVLINASIGGAMVLMSALLFPVKEWVSSTIEGEARLDAEAPHEFPLWFQALEEVKLLVFFLTAQMTIFWVGYPPDPSRRHVATALSYLYLLSTFGIDFISPTLQRHRQRYSVILKVLLRNLPATLSFGALFVIPVVWVGKLVIARTDISTEAAMTALLGANVVAVSWGIAAGTWVGAQLLPEARHTQPAGRWPRITSWVILLSAFGANAYAYGAMGVSVHHKSQILKCEYRVDWGTIEIDRPGLAHLLGGEIRTGLHFDLTIHNPTPYPVVLEDNRLELVHDRSPLAVTRLSPMGLKAGGTQTQRVDLQLELNAFALLKGRDLLRDHYSVTLYVKVAPGIELPVYLRAAKR